MASRHPAQPSYLTTGAATGHPGTVKPPGMTRKSQADRVIGLPRQKSIEYTTIWVNRASAPWPVGTLSGILACELEAHSVHLISLCVGALEGHSTDITRRVYLVPRKKGSFFRRTCGSRFIGEKPTRRFSREPSTPEPAHRTSAAAVTWLSPMNRLLPSQALDTIKKTEARRPPFSRCPGRSPCPGDRLTC